MCIVMGSCVCVCVCVCVCGVSYLHFALYRSVTVFIIFYSEYECTCLLISTFDSILKWMLNCSYCDIIYYVGGGVINMS